MKQITNLLSNQPDRGARRRQRDLLTQRPWREDLGGAQGMPAGMLTPAEGALLFHLARDYYSGQGEIIDAGAFLGSSSYCLSKGLEQNQHVQAKLSRIHAYDLFTVWLEQGATEAFMASELRRGFNIDVEGGKSTLGVYATNLGALLRHICVQCGDITTMDWDGRPIEILFLDICKTVDVWRHILKTFYAKLIPGVSLVVHQDYHHPLLPFIHVAQERLAPYFEIVEERVVDSAVFRLSKRIPDELLREVAAYEYDADTQIRLMDSAIARIEGTSQHLRIAKVQLLRELGRIDEARALLDELLAEKQHFTEDFRFKPYTDIMRHRVAAEEAKSLPRPFNFDEKFYLAQYPDVARVVREGIYASGFHHWLAFGKSEKRLSEAPKPAHLT